MIRSFTIILICSISFNTCFSVGTKDDAGLALLRKNLIANLLNDKQSDKRTTEGLSQLKEDGSFSDVNYLDKTKGVG